MKSYLNLLVPHAPGRDLVVPTAPAPVVVGTGGQEGLDLPLVLEDDVEVALGDGRVVLARPLNADRPETVERGEEGSFCNVPRHSTEEHLAGEHGVPHRTGW